MNDENKKHRVDATKFDGLHERILYIVFMVLVSATLAFSIVEVIVSDDKATYISHIFQCVLALICIHIPYFFKKALSWYIPPSMYIFILIFIYAHFILGEVGEIYKASAVFDKILHTSSGLVIALIGLSLVNILNGSNETQSRLSPFFVGLFSFCFAITIGVIWELFEYFMDSVFGQNMQRWDPPAELAQTVAPRQGYGLIDTMGDLIVSTVSALFVSILGGVGLKYKKSFLNKLLIRKVRDIDSALAEAADQKDKNFEKKVRRYIEKRGIQKNFDSATTANSADDITDDATEDATGDANADDTTGDVAENVTEDDTENVTENVAEDVTENVAEDVTENVAENVTENVTKDGATGDANAENGATDDVAEDNSADDANAENVTEDNSTEDVTENVTKDGATGDGNKKKAKTP